MNERIDKLNKQGGLIANREKFKYSKEKFQGAISDLGTDYNDSSDQEALRVQLNNGRYNSDKVLTVSNTLIVRGFIEFISVKIDARIIEVEAEILKG
ncbi:MAG: hypothetical protein GY834_16455 [Bacteroidetes bacterium]|nr:hypothetical protein [Bacteroidota bacterium]